jgi:hypothetical protein
MNEKDETTIFVVDFISRKDKKHHTRKFRSENEGNTWIKNNNDKIYDAVPATQIGYYHKPTRKEYKNS